LSNCYYPVFYTDPQSDGGNGTGEVMAGSDSGGSAQAKSDALRMAENHIKNFLGKKGS